MTSSESNLATAKTILSTVGSIAATVVVVRGVAHDLLPPEFQDYIFSGIRSLFATFSNQLTMVIDEFDGLDNNEIYEAAEIYLGPKVSPATRRLKISKPEKEKHFKITMEKDEEIIDIYNGEKFKWIWICRKYETKNFYNPRDMNSTLKSEEKKTIKIFTVDYENMYDISNMWVPVTFDHPATFETLAMDSDQKEMILKDLERFVGRKEYYKKVGKAWKRGYLLYGPPGTGKSSLIAAMANYLNFDVYDLELTELRKNSELRRLLVGTANKSILVVEDIDCTIDLQQKLANRDTSSPESHHQEESKVTLSGLLNFVDGLWSSCGDERIIIFTHLTTSKNSTQRTCFVQEIEDLIRKAKVTPAEVAEQLLKDDDHDVALQGLIGFIHEIKENEVADQEDEKAKGESGDKKLESVEQEEIKVNGEEKGDSKRPDQDN
ncbi:hypothetical protein DH2020_040582 [Rehmannia glutinosa]|uniref:AAA+ ATPase domain-containing protein n=1 Tax=Rehmannia glutinosa TaxID=99300 RepID=A0ABR0UT73_REHGL